jgi:hypothetical protein
MINTQYALYYKKLFFGLLIVISSFLLIVLEEQQAITQQGLNTNNSNSTTTATTINQTELDEWFNSLPDGTYGTIVDLHTYNSTNDYKGEDYSNSVDENASLISVRPTVWLNDIFI